MDKITILIAGYGYIGEAFVKAGFAHEIFQFHVIKRKPVTMPKDVNPIYQDLTQIKTEALPKTVDYVIYMAAPDMHSLVHYQQTYIDGLANLTEALRGHEVKRFIYVSSTGVYGENNGDWVTEESPTSPDSQTSQILVRSEEIVRHLPWSNIILRFGGIYGPGRERLLRLVKAKDITLKAHAQYSNRVHRDDCVGVLWHMLNLNEAAPCYNVVDNHPCDRNELIKWLVDNIHRDDTFLQTTADDGVSGKRVSNQLLLDSGYEFIFPDYTSGYHELLDDDQRRL